MSWKKVKASWDDGWLSFESMRVFIVAIAVVLVVGVLAVLNPQPALTATERQQIDQTWNELVAAPAGSLLVGKDGYAEAIVSTPSHVGRRVDVRSPIDRRMLLKGNADHALRGARVITPDNPEYSKFAAAFLGRL